MEPLREEENQVSLMDDHQEEMGGMDDLLSSKHPKMKTRFWHIDINQNSKLLLVKQENLRINMGRMLRI